MTYPELEQNSWLSSHSSVHKPFHFSPLEWREGAMYIGQQVFDPLQLQQEV